MRLINHWDNSCNILGESGGELDKFRTVKDEGERKTKTEQKSALSRWFIKAEACLMTVWLDKATNANITSDVYLSTHSCYGLIWVCLLYHLAHTGIRFELLSLAHELKAHCD